MTPEEYEKVHAVLCQLAEEEPTARDALLVSLCKDDSQLRADVEKMLEQLDGETFSLMEIAAPSLRTTGDDDAQDQAGTIPEWIGGYRVIRRIGVGGMGTVYEAEQENPRRIVALKVVRPDVVSPMALKRLSHEAHVLGQVHHPNVAGVFDAGVTEQGHPYFVMELVNGIPITDYCDRNRQGIDERLELFIQVCQAVQHAHLKGIIHRDLKPSNVLVECKDGKTVPKIIDFGIAKATDEKLTDRTFVTEQGQVIGTPAYMSPEQADPTSQDIDTRSDIYSLGILLYELLVGILPFNLRFTRAVGMAEIQRIIREEDPPRPSVRLSDTGTKSPGRKDSDSASHAETAGANRRTNARTLVRRLRGDLDWIVMKCLEKDRGRRYETANGLVLDIRRHLRHEVVLAGPPSSRYRLKKFLRRNKGPVAVVATLVLTLAGGVAITTVMYLRAQAEYQNTLEAQLQEQQVQRAAEVSRDVANAVRSFLTEMLSSVDPDMEKGQDVTVREILDDAVEGIDSKLADRPEAEAAVRVSIGNSYLALGHLDKAESQLRNALIIRQRLLGDRHPDVVICLGDLAQVLQRKGRIAEAEQLLSQALQSRSTLIAEGQADVVADSLRKLAALMAEKGEPARAEALLEESKALRVE